MTMDSSVSIQPAAITSLSLQQSTTTLSNSFQADINPPSIVTYPPPVKFRFMRKIISGLNDIVVFVWICLRVVPAAILIVIGFVTLVGLSLALVASTGAIAMLTGNGILRAAHFAHYTNNASAALIGVVGSLISVFILGLFRPCIPKTRDEKGNEKIHWSIQACMCLLLSTLSGTIGSAVLLRGHVDLGGIDILHATRAGALGGAILGPGSVLIAPWVLATIFFVFSPVWLAISMGARWVGERSSGDWTERNRSYSYCYCCGTRDDPA